MKKIIFFLVVFLCMTEVVSSADLISMSKSGTPDDLRMLLNNGQYTKEEITRALYCPTQGGVKPPPLGGGFSVSSVGCGHD